MEPGPPLTTCTCSPNSSGAQGTRAIQVSGIQTSLGRRVRPCLKMNEWVKTMAPKSWYLMSIFFANFQNDYLYFSNCFHWWYCKGFFWNQLCTDFIHFKSTFEFILSGISSHRLLGVPNSTCYCCFSFILKIVAFITNGYSMTCSVVHSAKCWRIWDEPHSACRGEIYCICPQRSSVKATLSLELATVPSVPNWKPTPSSQPKIHFCLLKM